jgi:hypothetical protein
MWGLDNGLAPAWAGYRVPVQGFTPVSCPPLCPSSFGRDLTSTPAHRKRDERGAAVQRGWTLPESDGRATCLFLLAA